MKFPEVQKNKVCFEIFQNITPTACVNLGRFQNFFFESQFHQLKKNKIIVVLNRSIIGTTTILCANNSM